ncbi:hypothetical protein IscW_ISCW022014 [Ixodes scapularis]|uniref:Uncharacterized protein n=1 Tax=Ixodes scapularis TaxID=6945 RepID=B7QEE8_IXOSC|nr:hypothetical protein IscW_ISCW022014 [Ixodes scapularis]|eukprot:XP_002413912.1 hypothetical protein IscW_ISCW022014 [Ixodes scapularis]
MVKRSWKPMLSNRADDCVYVDAFSTGTVFIRCRRWKARLYGTSEVDIEIDDLVCGKVNVIIVNDSALPVDMLVGRTWTEQGHIAYLPMGDELRTGYRGELPFCDNDLAQMKPSKEPLHAKETMVLP